MIINALDIQSGQTRDIEITHATTIALELSTMVTGWIKDSDLTAELDLKNPTAGWKIFPN